MRRMFLAFALLALCAAPAFARQQATIEAEIKRVMPYTRMLREDPTLTINDYNAVVRAVAKRRVEQQANEPETGLAPSEHRPLVPEMPLYTPLATTLPTTWFKSLNGETDGIDSNLKTGSVWNSTRPPDGSMGRFDNKTTSWIYDAQTKTYINFGTGLICTGEGSARLCSQ
jgi:hypothetical protein